MEGHSVSLIIASALLIVVALVIAGCAQILLRYRRGEIEAQDYLTLFPDKIGYAEPFPVTPTQPVRAYGRNAPGDFFVQDDCCLLCGVPWHIAPDLFSHDNTSCWVSRQPLTPDEQRRMLQVVETQELDCIRYRGRDATLLRVLPPSVVDDVD